MGTKRKIKTLLGLSASVITATTLCSCTSTKRSAETGYKPEEFKATLEQVTDLRNNAVMNYNRLSAADKARADAAVSEQAEENSNITSSTFIEYVNEIFKASDEEIIQLTTKLTPEQVEQLPEDAKIPTLNRKYLAIQEIASKGNIKLVDWYKVDKTFGGVDKIDFGKTTKLYKEEEAEELNEIVRASRTSYLSSDQFEKTFNDAYTKALASHKNQDIDNARMLSGSRLGHVMTKYANVDNAETEQEVLLGQSKKTATTATANNINYIDFQGIMQKEEVNKPEDLVGLDISSHFKPGDVIKQNKAAANAMQTFDFREAETDVQTDLTSIEKPSVKAKVVKVVSSNREGFKIMLNYGLMDNDFISKPNRNDYVTWLYDDKVVNESSEVAKNLAQMYTIDVLPSKESKAQEANDVLNKLINNLQYKESETVGYETFQKLAEEYPDYENIGTFTDVIYIEGLEEILLDWNVYVRFEVGASNVKTHFKVAIPSLEKDYGDEYTYESTSGDTKMNISAKFFNETKEKVDKVNMVHEVLDRFNSLSSLALSSPTSAIKKAKSTSISKTIGYALDIVIHWINLAQHPSIPFLLYTLGLTASKAAAVAFYAIYWKKFDDHLEELNDINNSPQAYLRIWAVLNSIASGATDWATVENHTLSEGDGEEMKESIDIIQSIYDMSSKYADEVAAFSVFNNFKTQEEYNEYANNNPNFNDETIKLGTFLDNKAIPAINKLNTKIGKFNFMQKAFGTKVVGGDYLTVLAEYEYAKDPLIVKAKKSFDDFYVGANILESALYAIDMIDTIVQFATKNDWADYDKNKPENADPSTFAQQEQANKDANSIERQMIDVKESNDTTEIEKAEKLNMLGEMLMDVECEKSEIDMKIADATYEWEKSTKNWFWRNKSYTYTAMKKMSGGIKSAILDSLKEVNAKTIGHDLMKPAVEALFSIVFNFDINVITNIVTHFNDKHLNDVRNFESGLQKAKKALGSSYDLNANIDLAESVENETLGEGLCQIYKDQARSANVMEMFQLFYTRNSNSSDYVRTTTSVKEAYLKYAESKKYLLFGGKKNVDEKVAKYGEQYITDKLWNNTELRKEFQDKIKDLVSDSFINGVTKRADIAEVCFWVSTTVTIVQTVLNIITGSGMVESMVFDKLFKDAGPIFKEYLKFFGMQDGDKKWSKNAFKKFNFVRKLIEKTWSWINTLKTLDVDIHSYWII